MTGVDKTKDIGHSIFRSKCINLPGIWVDHNDGVLGFTVALWSEISASCAVSILSNVGSSHAGEVLLSAVRIALTINFLQLAMGLAEVQICWRILVNSWSVQHLSGDITVILGFGKGLPSVHLTHQREGLDTILGILQKARDKFTLGVESHLCCVS